MAFFILFIIAIFVLQEWSQKNALKGIDYKYRCSQKLVEVDEDFHYISTISNFSRRFVPFLRIEETLPSATEINQGQAKLRTTLMGQQKNLYTTYLTPKSQLERNLTLSISKRGTYLFSGANVTGGDFLGLSEDTKNFPSQSILVVYPKPADYPGLANILGGFMGDISVRRFIMEDPILTIGARDYTGREPLSQISWKQTARTNHLMVKQFDYTMEAKVSVLLDISTPHTFEPNEETLENCYRLARSICEELEDKKISYDFITNASGMGKTYVPEGLGMSHFHAILEKLGRGTLLAIEPFNKTIERLNLKQSGDRSTIIIVPESDKTKEQAAIRLQARGGTVTFIKGEDCHDTHIKPETHL